MSTAPRVSITQFSSDIERSSIYLQDYFQQCHESLAIQSVELTSVRRAVSGHPASKFGSDHAKTADFSGITSRLRPSGQIKKNLLSTQYGRRIRNMG